MPKLIFHDSDGIDRSVDLGSEPILIGRAPECQVQTQDALVSRRHARVLWDGSYWIEDLGSSNGVYVGGEKVQKAAIRPGDEMRCGSLILRLVPELARSTVAPKQPAPPTMRAMPVSADSSPAASSPKQPISPLSMLRSEIDQERSRRMQAEDAVLLLEQRASLAEQKLAEADSRAHALELRLWDAQAQIADSARTGTFEAPRLPDDLVLDEDSNPVAHGEAMLNADHVLGDALENLRGGLASLRDARDEVGVLGVEAPSDAVTVLKDALDSVSLQVETASVRIVEARALLESP